MLHDRTSQGLPVTGELLAFSYFSFEQPFLQYIRVGTDGKLKQLEGIELPEMVMMHDFNITENYVIFMDLPLAFDLDLLASGIPFRFKRENQARLALCRVPAARAIFVGLKSTRATSFIRSTPGNRAMSLPYSYPSKTQHSAQTQGFL